MTTDAPAAPYKKLTLTRGGMKVLRALVRFRLAERLTTYFEEHKDKLDSQELAMDAIAAFDEVELLHVPMNYLETIWSMTPGMESGAVFVQVHIFSALKEIVDAEVNPGRMKALTQEEAEAMLRPLRDMQKEMRLIFASAEDVSMETFKNTRLQLQAGETPDPGLRN